MPPSLSELTPIIFNMELTHLDWKASISPIVINNLILNLGIIKIQNISLSEFQSITGPIYSPTG